MVSTNALLAGLAGLISIDVVITLFAVGALGATEINPIAGVIGFAEFMILKVAVSSAALYFMYRYLNQFVPTLARYGACFLIAVYGAVFASNAYQVAGRLL